MTMQFVVGATPDTDRTLLGTINGLKAGGGVHHPHFSAFRPISDTPMEDAPATPALREHRLYQAAYLLRAMVSTPEEVVYGPTATFRSTLDPNVAWALAHPELFPLEIQRVRTRSWSACPGSDPRRAADRGAAKHSLFGGWPT